MKTTKKIDMYFNRIQSIRYENEHGGAYAYIQYLAYTRELLVMLRPLKKVEKQLEALEGINWLFNEHLAFKFTHRHKVIFEEKLHETQQLFNIIRHSLKKIDLLSLPEVGRLHAQAA
jgi:hypothetical protein